MQQCGSPEGKNRILTLMSIWNGEIKGFAVSVQKAEVVLLLGNYIKEQ